MKEKIKILYKLLELSKKINNKYLIKINIEDIIYIWIANLLFILKKLNIQEINIQLNSYTNKNINEIQKLKKIWLNIKVFLYIDNEKTQFTQYINSNIKIINNFIFNIKYNKNNIKWLKNNINFINTDSKIYLWLDNFWEQNKNNIKYFLEIFNIMKNEWLYIDKDYIRKESAYKNILILWPKEVNFDVNELCNANCIFCYSNWPWNKEFKHKTHINSLVSIVKQLDYLWTDSILLWTRWEPFLVKEYIEKLFNEINKTYIKIWFLTNWYWLLENIDTIINSNNIKHFCINISAWDYESFKSTRIWNLFYKFLNTWKAIKIIKNKRPDIIIKVLYVTTALNIKWIDNFIKISEKNNVNEIEIRKVILYWLNKEIVLTNSSNKQLINTLQKFKNLKIKNNIIKLIQELSDNKQTSKNKTIPKKCYNQYLYWLIRKDNLYSCCRSVYNIWKIKDWNINDTFINIDNENKIFKISQNLESVIWKEEYWYKCKNCFQKYNIEEIENYINLKNSINNIKKLNTIS